MMKDNHYKNEQTAKSGMPIFNVIGFNFKSFSGCPPLSQFHVSEKSVIFLIRTSREKKTIPATYAEIIIRET